jgi:hypothetical protein
VGGRRYGEPEPDEPHYEVEEESRLTLREAAPVEGTGFEYVYDLGNNWAHEVVVEKIEAIRDRRHPEHENLLARAGGRFDPEAFDLAAVNRRLRWLKRSLPAW